MKKQPLKKRPARKPRPYKPTVDPLLNPFGEWCGAVGNNTYLNMQSLSVSQIQDLMWQAARWGYTQGYIDGLKHIDPRLLKLAEQGEPARVPWPTVPLDGPIKLKYVQGDVIEGATKK